MLSEAQWTMLEPLVQAYRPKGKTPPSDLQRTISAILWRHQNGAKWRAVPEELGPWWRAAQVFIRWDRAGVWERLLVLVQERGVQLGMVFLDGTSVRAHQKAAGAAKKGDLGPSEIIVRRLSALPITPWDRPKADGRSRGGYGTKACVIADGTGHAIAFRVAPGQAHELPHAVPLLRRLPSVPKWVVGDRGYTSHRFREPIWNMGARPAIPPQRYEAPVACRDWIYNNRNVVERLWARLKAWRAVATRYEKTAASFSGVLCLAAALDRLKR